MAVTVRTFGAFQLAFDGRPVQRWKAGKARNLLQFLLLRPGRIVSRDTLYDALWPDASWSKDSSSLKVAAHMLRRVLDAGQAREARPALELLTRDSGYLLQAVDVDVDFERFGRLADAAHAAQLHGDRAAAAQLYRQAARLYRDDFLPDEPYEWAATQREALRSRLLCGVMCLVETDIRGGDHVGVIRWCQRLLEMEPLHEEAYRALMLVHAQLGQLEQVRRWYELCADRLRDHLQLAPEAATRRLYARAVCGSLTGRPVDLQTWRQDLAPDGCHPSLLRTTS